MPLVSVFMDVEDPINPLADQAALDLALLFSEARIRGCFCLTGEKCRTLVARGRQDILDAYRPHCLGLHTDTHSYHPTTMELLADVPYEGGCGLAYRAEKKGLEAFLQAFDRTPSFWGGAGNTWSPEIAFALSRLDIPAYVYALTALPGAPIHKFKGVTAFPQHLSISEADWAAGSTRPREVLDIVTATTDQEWLGIFVGHPTRLRHTDYWDVPFMKGRTPDVPELAVPVDEPTYRRSLANLKEFLLELSYLALVAGLDSVQALPRGFRKPTPEELVFFREETAHNLRGAAKWPVHRPDLDAENIVQKTLALEGTLQIADASVPSP